MFLSQLPASRCPGLIVSAQGGATKEFLSVALQGSVQFLEIKRGGKGEQLETLCAAYCQPQTCCEWTGGWNHDPATLLFKTWLPKCPACQRIHPHSGHVAEGLTAQYQALQSPLVSQAHPSHPDAVSSSSSRPFCWERPVHSACSTTQDDTSWHLRYQCLATGKRLKRAWQHVRVGSWGVSTVRLFFTVGMEEPGRWLEYVQS